MSIEFDDNVMEVSCDLCRRRTQFFFGGYDQAWRDAEEAGWTQKTDRCGNTEHFCPGCSS